MALPDPSHSAAVLIGTANYPKGGDYGNLPAVWRNLTGILAALTNPAVGGLDPHRCTVVRDPQVPVDIAGPVLDAAKWATDCLIVYYAGHGIPDDKNELYLGLRKSTRTLVNFDALQFERLRPILSGARARCRILILDCCFSGLAVEGAMTDPKAAIAGQIEISGVYTLTSTRRDKPGMAPSRAKYTAFTGALLDVLNNGVRGAGPELALSEIFAAVRKQLADAGMPEPLQGSTRDAYDLALVRNTAHVPPPAPAEALETLDPSNVFQLCSELKDLVQPDDLAIGLVKAVDRASPHQAWVLRTVARLPGAAFSTRVAALEAMVDRHRSGRPWRAKEWRNGESWRDDDIGVSLLELLGDHRNETLALLERWLRDTRPFEPLDKTSRQDIATAVLVANYEMEMVRYETLARDDPDNFGELIRYTAMIHPQAISPLAQQWANSDDDALRFAALDAVYGLNASDSRLAIIAPPGILRSLATAEWPRRMDAVTLLAALRPDEPGRREEIFAAVDNGQLAPSALQQFLARHPDEVLATLESNQHRTEVLEATLDMLRDWFPTDESIEERALALVAAAENDPGLAARVGMVAEYAIYQLYKRKSVSTGRLDVGLRLLVSGPEAARRPIYYGLAMPSGPPSYEAYRRDAVDALQQGDGRAAGTATLLIETFRQTDDQEWPTAEFAVALLARLSPVEISKVLLDAATFEMKGRAAAFVAELARSGLVDADAQLRAFANAFQRTGDSSAALRRATSTR